MSIFNVAVTSLNAAQVAVQTTSHNIANASTVGYSRQRIVQTTNTPLLSGAGFLGQGSNVETIQRVYSQHLSSQILSSQTGASEMDSYLSQISQIDNLLADPSAGLSPVLGDFFKSVQELAANPSSIPARQALISGAQSLVARFQATDLRLQEIRDGINSQVTSEVATINAIGNQIGELNQQIIASQATAGGQPNNDLLDQRDNLIAELNKHIRVQTVTQSDGSFSAFIGSGQPLVVGTLVSTLSTTLAVDDPEKVTISLNAPFGGSITLDETQLTGGSLGGLLSFRRESLDPAQDGIGRLALGLAQYFNEVHHTGQDLTGALGTDFFTLSAPVVNASSLNVDPASVVSAQIISSDYLYDVSNNTVTRLSDGTSFPFTSTLGPGGNLTYFDGLTLSFDTGSSNPGDYFIIRPGNDPGNRVIPYSTNTGNGTYNSSGSNVQALVNSEYRLDVLSTGQWRLTRVTDDTSWTSTGGLGSDQAELDSIQRQTQLGFNLTFSGTVASVGDSFVIQPTRQAARNIAVAISDPRAIAAAAPFRTSAALANKGTAAISAGAVEAISSAPIGTAFALSPAWAGDITLTYNSTTLGFDVAVGGAATGTFIPYDPSTQTQINAVINGLSATISGRPENGDIFTFSQNLNGVSDNRTAQLLGALQVKNVMNGSSSSYTTGATATFQSVLSQIVSQVGNKTHEVRITGAALQTLVDQTTDTRNSLSGVNLDEEAANLLKFQQAYQASAKMLQIASTLFEEILALGR